MLKRTPIIAGVLALSLTGAWFAGQTTAPVPAHGEDNQTYTAPDVAEDTPVRDTPTTSTPDITVNPCGAEVVPYTVPGVCADENGVHPVPTPTATPDVSVPAYSEDAPLSEDDPGWDCTTMGNRICGPEASPVTVSEGTIWPCSVWATDAQTIPDGVRGDVCVTEDGNYSFPFDN